VLLPLSPAPADVTAAASTIVKRGPIKAAAAATAMAREQGNCSAMAPYLFLTDARCISISYTWKVVRLNIEPAFSGAYQLAYRSACTALSPGPLCLLVHKKILHHFYFCVLLTSHAILPHDMLSHFDSSYMYV
jgi:hypothetical protein